MIRRIIVILVLILLLTSCGGAAPATQAPAETEAPATEAPTEEPAATEPPEFPSPEPPTLAATQPPPTASAEPTSTQIPETPTDTPLPTLDLPTEIVNAPEQLAWDGVPTYLAESTPGFAFRVRYAPDIWALTTDQFGFAALAHRTIPGCVISVTSGRGLPINMTVEHEMLTMNDVTFDVGNVFENGVLKFITYTGGNANIITGFQLDFEEQPEQCRSDAITVLSTLMSVRASQATPTATP
ncbi:MAG TPA: hypothetical protein VFG81_11635 [Anaerolineales bacterium]|jgi:hypothetical protein|nr:hypothetical protein [Anaerolineales bacterium]